ncbi:hypothetical protein [Agrobacterium arsenijevicii]|uniref:Transmembrane protein n=1 Tax=Agrobacterium arsenijevicii TaxID=1585697 RepID=A0ABR5D9X0_9HYPH|nr:hypothetical protein RP75_07170 [Agrobacterium arsenijevicii]
MNYIALFVVTALFSSIFSTQAEARKVRLFAVPGFGSSETIDLVYDLPDSPPFLREGKAYDIGYLNSSKGNAYVLYQGDRYGKLSDAEIATLEAALGFDPTAKHRAERAARSAAFEEAFPWSSVTYVLILVAGVFMLLRKGVRILRRAAPPSVNGSIDEDNSVGAVYPPSEARKAQMMSRQQTDDAMSDNRRRTAAPPTVSGSSRSGPPVKAFGRRSA